MNGKLLNNITAGNYDVTQFYGLDEKTKTVYYQSAEPSPLERHVYRCRLDGSGKIQLTESAGWNEAEFNNDFSFFLQTWSNANTPFIFSIHSSNGKPVRVLETNEALQAKRKQYNFQDVEFYQFAISSGEKLNGFMLKPQNFDASKKYPVFMTLYGGPGSQEVVNQYGASSNWHQYLLQQGYIVACVDNRGTGGRGEEFKKCTYLRLGEWEVQDQIEAAKHLGSLPYVDASRIGIFGWSYGGYMSTFCLAQGNSVFKAAIAVAPVTDWRFYDTIYTERFMRTEKENKEGYDRTAPLNFADKIRGNYLLVHGLADDNVHYQNAAELMKKLYASNVKFDQFTFPDKNHGIYGGNTRYYLFSQILDWIEENL
jgi:dipeptidyl-peptidase-4